MNRDDMDQRMAYFAAKLDDAKQRAAAKQTYPKAFSAGFTTEKLKSWRDAISLIRERIADIEAQIPERQK